MKNLSDLEQEKQQILRELEELKKQIQQDINLLKAKYDTKNIAKNITHDLSKRYINKHLVLILAAAASTMLLLYLLSRRKRQKKVGESQCTKTAHKSNSGMMPVPIKAKKSSFVLDLAKEVAWTITMEMVRKKVNEYLKKKNEVRV